MAAEAEAMIVVGDYRHHRIDINAVPAGEGRFDAEVRIRRTLSEEKPHVESVSAALAESAGELFAKRIDMSTRAAT